MNPEKIVQEIARVLKPGGTLTAMVYNRTSANYYLQICVLRRIGRLLLKPAWAPRLLSRILGLPVDKLEGHRRNLGRIPNPTHQQWISMNTDGPDCPLARVYNAAEAAALFASLAPIRTEVYHFDRSHWSFLGRILPSALAATLGRKWGWHRLIYGTKPRLDPAVNGGSHD